MIKALVVDSASPDLTKKNGADHTAFQLKRKNTENQYTINALQIFLHLIFDIVDILLYFLMIFFSARFIRNSIFLVHIFSAENLVNSNPIITTLAFMKRL